MLKTTFIILIMLGSTLLAQQKNDFGNQFALGQAFLQGGQYEKAKTIYEELYKKQPGNYQVFTALNNSYIQLKDYASSISIIENRIKTSPQDINLYGLLGSTYYVMGNENKAFEVWDNATEKVDNKEVSYRVMANYAIERRAFEKAIEFLQKGKAASSNPKYFSYDLGNLYALTMQFKKAAAEYCSIIISAPEQANSVNSRIMSYINKPGALEQTISVVEGQDNNNINIESLLASLYKEAGNYDKAFELYKNIESLQNNQGGVLIRFAHYLFSEKQFSKSAEVYNYIITHYPDSPFTANAKLGYAKTLQASLDNDDLFLKQNWKPYFISPEYPQEKIDNIVSAYTEIIKLYPNTEVGNEAYLNIGNLYFEKMNNPGEAEKYYNTLISRSPNSPIVADAYLQLGNISISKGNLDEATIIFNKVINFKRTGSDKKNIARYHLAKIDFYKGRFDNSRNILAEIIGDLEDNTANDALELSLLLNTAKNDSANLAKFADADLLRTQMKFSDSESIYEEISKNPRAFILNNIAGIRSAEMDIATDSLNKAISKLSQITGEKEKNIYSDKALYLKAKIYQFGLKNAPKAIKTYQDLLADFPNSIYLDEARKNIITLKNKTS